MARIEPYNLEVDIKYVAVTMIGKSLIGGFVFGYIVAEFTKTWLRRVTTDSIQTINIVICSAYFVFIVSELQGFSGITALVVLGIYVKKDEQSS